MTMDYFELSNIYLLLALSVLLVIRQQLRATEPSLQKKNIRSSIRKKAADRNLHFCNNLRSWKAVWRACFLSASSSSTSSPAPTSIVGRKFNAPHETLASIFSFFGTIFWTLSNFFSSFFSFYEILFVGFFSIIQIDSSLEFINFYLPRKKSCIDKVT